MLSVKDNRTGLLALGTAGLLFLFGRKRTAPQEPSPTPPRVVPELVPPSPVPPPPLPWLGSEELPPGFRLLRLVEPNLTGRDVRAVQQALWEAGFYPGPVHGVFDYLTSEAVKAFQRAKGLEVTGIVDTKTWLALGVLIEGPGGLEVAPKYVVWRVRG